MKEREERGACSLSQTAGGRFKTVEIQKVSRITMEYQIKCIFAY